MCSTTVTISDLDAKKESCITKVDVSEHVCPLAPGAVFDKEITLNITAMNQVSKTEPHPMQGRGSDFTVHYSLKLEVMKDVSLELPIALSSPIDNLCLDRHVPELCQEQIPEEIQRAFLLGGRSQAEFDELWVMDPATMDLEPKHVPPYCLYVQQHQKGMFVPFYFYAPYNMLARMDPLITQLGLSYNAAGAAAGIVLKVVVAAAAIALSAI
jgi:hypothetical protein